MTRAARLLLVLALLGGVVFFATEALADPHAVFYTDRAQEQLFYNVLAALNQADFVEPPGLPQVSPSPTPFPEFDPARPGPDVVGLPRIRVRAVTPDNGDLYYRLLTHSFNHAIKSRVDLDTLACNYFAYADPAAWEQNCLAPSASPSPTP